MAREVHGFDLDIDVFKIVEGVLAQLLPSTPNTPEGTFADWILVVLKALEQAHPHERFPLMLDASLRTIEYTYLDGTELPEPVRERFASDFYEAFEVLTLLRDQHAAPAAFLMAFLRAARTLDQ